MKTGIEINKRKGSGFALRRLVASLLVLVQCMSLAFVGAPVAYAESDTDFDVVQTGEPEPVGDPDPEPEPEPEEDPEPVEFTDGVLEADCGDISMSLSYGADAEIPEGAWLELVLPQSSSGWGGDQTDGGLDLSEGEVEWYDARMCEALGVSEGRGLFFGSTLVKPVIRTEEGTVVPAGAVEICIRFPEADGAQAETFGVVSFDETGAFGGHAGNTVLAACSGMNDEGCSVSFQVSDLTLLGVCSYAVRLLDEQTQYLQLSVFGPACASVKTKGTEPAPNEGEVLLEAVSFDVWSPAPDGETALWAQASLLSEPEDGRQMQLYTFNGDGLARLLSDAGGTDEPVLLRGESGLALCTPATEDELFSDDAITLVGAQLPGLVVDVSNVSYAYADYDFASLAAGPAFEPVLTQLKAESDAARPGFRKVMLQAVQTLMAEQSAEARGGDDVQYALIGAYDVSISLNGEDYQPNEENPIRVSIIDPAIEEAEDLQLWSIRPDDSREQVNSFSVDGDMLTFDAASSSVYLLFQTILIQPLTATDGSQYLITVSYDNNSGIPPKTELQVREICEGDAGYAEYFEKSAEALDALGREMKYARAFDITLVDPVTGEEYHPTKDVKVSIQLLDTDLSTYESVNVVHIYGEAEDQADVMDATLNGESVEFNTDGFSVYVVAIDDEPVIPYRLYSFWVWDAVNELYVRVKFVTESGDETYEQKVKNGERPVIPQPDEEATIDGKTGQFAGWYRSTSINGVPVLDDEPFDFDSELTGTDVDPVDLYAVYKEYLYVVFHDQYSDDIDGFPIAETLRGVPDSTTSKVTIKISDVSTTYNDGGDMAFYAWSYTPISVPGSDVDDAGSRVAPIVTGEDGSIEITVTTNGDGSVKLSCTPPSPAYEITLPAEEGGVSPALELHLYPIYKPIRWLTYWSGPTGSGATYFPAHYCFDGVGPASLPVPVRSGYTFKGWYSGSIDPETETVTYGTIALAGPDGALINDAEDGGFSVYGGNLHLSSDATLYAMWEGADSTSYKIIIWKQKSTATADTPAKYKYDFVESIVKTVEIGATATTEGYRTELSGYTCSWDDDVTPVNPSGYTVLNVYYDRIGDYSGETGSHTLKFVDTADNSDIRVYNSVPYNTDLRSYVPADPTRDYYSFTGWFADANLSTQVFFSQSDLDAYSGYNKTVLYDAMPNEDLTIYAGWEAEWYIVQIDPNYGSFNGSGSTWFWKTVDSDMIQEYTNVTRDYVESSSGTYYYVKHDRAYYGYSGNEWDNSELDRDAYYTTDPGLATEYTTFEYAPNVYRYAGWYEVHPDGTETRYDFEQHVDHDILLRLHWKRVDSFYLKYTAGEGTIQVDGDTVKEYNDPGTYADNAKIVITRSAAAPAGYAFAGWQVQGDTSGTTYGVGDTFTLQSDYAVSISGKETVTLEAVYVKIGTAQIIYDFNGATLPEGASFDYGSPAPQTSLAADRKSATVSNLENNSVVVLSSGAGLSMPGATLVGWSSSKAYDPNRDTLFNAGASNETYGVDTAEPVTLYAVWESSVTFHLNSTTAGWGGTWDPSVYTYDAVSDSYSQTVYLGNAVSEPDYIPTNSDAAKMFRFWVTAPDGTTAYDFAEPVEAALDLYAYWGGLIEVPVHAVDASEQTLTAMDDTWLITAETKIPVGTDPVPLTAADVDAFFGDGCPPEDYVFAFAAAHRRTDSLQTLSEDEAVTSIYYDQSDKHLHVTRADGSDVSLDEDVDIYLVCYRQKALDIGYKSMASSGALGDVTATGAPTTTGASLLGEYDAAASLTTPLGWVSNSYAYYAFAIGAANAGNASNLSLITTASNSDGARPALLVKNTWRGFQYSEDGGASWVNCGYDLQLYVIYYSQQPTVVVFQEQTLGHSAIRDNTAFIYELVVTETTTTTVSTQRQKMVMDGDTATWVNFGEPTTQTETSDPVTVYGPDMEGAEQYYTTYELRNGEAKSAILFYSSTAEGPTEGQTYEENGETFRNVTTTTVVKAQTADITQRPNPNFATAINGTEQTATPYCFTYSSDGSGGTVTATFTNTHKQAQVFVYAARIENGELVPVSGVTNKSFTLPIDQEAKLLTELPADEVYTDPDGIYVFGTAIYGELMGVESVAYVKNQAGNYELLLKDGSGNTLAEMSSDKQIYYLYYPMPKIQYVKQTGEGLNATLARIKGSTDGLNPSLTITYGRATIEMNDQTVAQDQSVTVPQNGLVISQALGSTNFKMPPVLDDATYVRYLSYSAIGIGPSVPRDGTQSVNAEGVYLSDTAEMQLQIRDNKLVWSFDGSNWYPLNEDQRIYAVYVDRGYDFQLSKTVDIEESGNNPIFTERLFNVTISSLGITRSSYSIVGWEVPTISATPADLELGTPGTIELEVKDGFKVKINGLGHGDYTITETKNENFTLTAKSGPIVDKATTTETVTDNSSVTLTLDSEKQLVLTNTPNAICKIVYNGTEHLFYTLRDAVDYVENEIDGSTAAIEMLVDYYMPAEDTLEIPGNVNITLTTAANGTYVYHGSGANNRAIISRSEALADLPMITNDGQLTLRNITLDGKSLEASAPMILQNRGTLTTDRGTTLQNAVSTGNGGAIHALGGNVNLAGPESTLYGSNHLTNNQAAKGGLVYFEGDGVLTVSGGSITGNKATDNGGAIYAVSGSVKVQGGTMSGNTSDNIGGAIYAESSMVQIEGGSISGNSAVFGGAVGIGAGTLELKTGGSVTGNEARRSAGTEESVIPCGGAFYANNGTITVSGGSMSGNRAAEGYGGAIYTKTGTVNVSGGSIGEGGANTAINGAAVFVDAGSGYFSGGVITGNTASSGGAVGFGVDENDAATTKLHFSGNAQITGNTCGGAASNVYLNADSDGVINTAGLGNDANIGIYVPDKSKDGKEYLFKNRGDVGAKFGSYTGTSNVNKFHNDRQPNLGVTTDSTSMKLLWGSPIKVRILYLAQYGAYPNGFPPIAAGTERYTNNSYYPTASDVAFSEMGETLREKYSIDLGGSVYGAAFLNTASTYTDYITKLVWEDTDGDNNYVWKVVKGDGTRVLLNADNRIDIYYSEPAYISIENNSFKVGEGDEATELEYKLKVDVMTVMGQSVINNYGLVFAKNGAIQTALLPVTEEDLTLSAGESINILVPGGRNQTYTLKGTFTDKDGTALSDDTQLKLKRTGLSPETPTVGEMQDPGLTGTTLNNGETYEIIFGDEKYICKIVNGAEEVRFPTMNAAVQYAIAHRDDFDQTQEPITIEMLMDYLMPANDVVEIKESDGLTNIKLTTATTGKYQYPETEGSTRRATISRASGNTAKPLFTVTGNSGAINMNFAVEQLDFDGKNLAGSCDGGAIKTKNSKVTITNADFKDFKANNGGAVFVSFGDEKSRSGYEYNFDKFPGLSQYPNIETAEAYEAYEALFVNAVLTVTNANFTNCESRATRPRCGGGAVWTNARDLEMSDCNFDTCVALKSQKINGVTVGNDANQGGAVFHRIDGPTQKNYAWQPYGVVSESNVSNCTFTSCNACAGGGIELDTRMISMSGCDFYSCTTSLKDGGAINIYIFENVYERNPLPSKMTLDSCRFVSCTAARNGGAVRTMSLDTIVNNCDFINTTAKVTGSASYFRGGGAITVSNKDAKSLTVTHSNFEGTTVNDRHGGAIYTEALELTINGGTRFSNCEAKKGSGGAIYHDNNQSGASFAKIENSTISGCTAALNGGGYYTNNVKGLTVSDNSTINGCKATTGNGGGICYDTTSGPLTISESTISENEAAGAASKGGGIYVKKNLVLQNATVVDNVLSHESAVTENAAGIYILNGGTLTVGTTGADCDHTVVMGNTMKDKKPSNLRLPENNGVNSKCVTVRCNLGPKMDGENPVDGTGVIYVVNAKVVGTWFGNSDIVNPDGFSDTDAVFKADYSTLHGIINRQDTTHKQIIWAGPPVCKITDADGNLLYFKNTGADPAIFDVLDDGVNPTNNNPGRSSAFAYLRNASPKLYREDGTAYNGPVYQVQMIVGSYELVHQIGTVDNSERTIILTTASKSDTDGYPLDKDAPSRCTITRGEDVTGSMALVRTNMQFTNIVLDGSRGDNESVLSEEEGAIIRVAGTKAITVELLNNALLRYGKAANGGAVAVKNGNFRIREGLIRYCEATGNGGAVYMDATKNSDPDVGLDFKEGSIQQCSAMNGGGVYVNNGVFNMSGGNISSCSARESGGGVFVGEGMTLDMSGGSIGYIAPNNAGTHGGGIAVGGDGATLMFTKQVYVSRNTCDASDATDNICNVELNYDTNFVINTKDRLYGRSYIGVYVSGVFNPLTDEDIANDRAHHEGDTPQYSIHGGRGDPFGTFTGTSSQLYCFVNDRNGLKGGLIANPEPNTIYWIKIFTVRISKEVDTSEHVPASEQQAALDQLFKFKVRLWDTNANTSGITVADIAADIADAKARGEESKYGTIPFEVSPNASDLIEATVSLKSGESISAENLPDGLGYDVIEYAQPGYAAIRTGVESHERPFANNPSRFYGGVVGENKDRRDGVNPYSSDIDYTNIRPVCKITDADGKLLYFWRKVEQYKVVNTNEVKKEIVSVYVPAVFLELSEAFDVVNNAYSSSQDALHLADTETSYSGNYRIELLVPDYTLTETLTLTLANNRRVTLSTAEKGSLDTAANSSDADTFPFTGTGDKATIKRDTDFNTGSMFQVAANSDLTIENIALDGNLVEVAAGTSGGIAYVPAGATLRITDKGELKNSRTVDNGAGVYLATGGRLHLSGAPLFGGTDVDPADGFINNAVGNFKVGTLTDQKNGGWGYTVAHQDIYLEENNSEMPACIIVDGMLSGENGSIWVWAESEYHYPQLKPFGVLESYNDDGELDGGNLAIFRDARDDETTGNTTASYLYGTKVGPTAGYVYWNGVEGSHRIILRKVKLSGFATYQGAEFTVYAGIDTNPYVDPATGEELKRITDSDNEYGIFWVGDLPYGIYYLEEHAPQNGKWFYLIVEDPEYCSPDPLIGGAYNSRADARTAAETKYAEIAALKQQG